VSKKYRSDAMAAIHETMEALRDVGAVGNQTMRHFDDACLSPIWPLKPNRLLKVTLNASLAAHGAAPHRQINHLRLLWRGAMPCERLFQHPANETKAIR
jgi:DNA-binding transcriptional regulator YiaG